MTTVNNYNVTDMVAIRMGKSKREVAEIFAEILQVISEELANGNDVVVNSFCKFEHVHQSARVGRNPQTGETIDVPEKTVIKVRRRKLLNDYTNVEYTQLPEDIFAAIEEYRAKRIN